MFDTLHSEVNLTIWINYRYGFERQDTKAQFPLYVLYILWHDTQLDGMVVFHPTMCKTIFTIGMSRYLLYLGIDTKLAADRGQTSVPASR